MARTPKGNNAFALAHGSRLAADSTHGVTCTFAGGCRVFDANISKKHENHWRCERHGGANNHARANAKASIRGNFLLDSSSPAWYIIDSWGR